LKWSDHGTTSTDGSRSSLMICTSCNDCGLLDEPMKRRVRWVIPTPRLQVNLANIPEREVLQASTQVQKHVRPDVQTAVLLPQCCVRQSRNAKDERSRHASPGARRRRRPRFTSVYFDQAPHLWPRLFVYISYGI
jgi:hypothetical protein